MRWASGASCADEPEDAAREVGEALATALGEGPVDLVLFFFTAALATAADAMAAVLRERLSPGCIAGVSGVSVVGTEHEFENDAALTAIAARMPGVAVKP